MRQAFGPRDPFAMNAPCQLPQEATAPEVIAYLNANTARISSWRSSHVRITGRGAAATPVSIAADVSIQAPRNFRLRAKQFVEEVDIGSNDQQFWFWNRQSEEKYVFVAYHDEEALSNRRFPIPFQPDWVMEAFGVMPIDPANKRAEPGPPGSQMIRLISEHVSPQGKRIRKVTEVDTCRGVIHKHELLDEQGTIASAVMDNYWRDPVTQAVLPQLIHLDWPRAKMGLTMNVSLIEVNPLKISDAIWQRPTKDGYQVFELNHTGEANPAGARPIGADGL